MECENRAAQQTPDHHAARTVIDTVDILITSGVVEFFLFGIDEHPIWQRWFESWKNKEEVFIAHLAGQEKEEYFNNINNHRNYLPAVIGCVIE